MKKAIKTASMEISEAVELAATLSPDEVVLISFGKTFLTVNFRDRSQWRVRMGGGDCKELLACLCRPSVAA